MLSKVLLIEDVKEVQIIVKATLKAEADLHCADNLQEGLHLLNQNDYSLLLLDGSLPDGDGFEFCRQLRMMKKFEDLAIIFLTARKELEQKVLGFSLGADDYITKPIEPTEFSARILAKLKRVRAQSSSIRLGPYHIDLKTQKAQMKADGGSEELSLTPSEFKIFSYLCRHEGKTVSRAELIQQVWGDKVHVSDHTVDTHVSSLRKKLGENSKIIKSVVKNGFRAIWEEGA